MCIRKKAVERGVPLRNSLTNAFVYVVALLTFGGQAWQAGKLTHPTTEKTQLISPGVWNAAAMELISVQELPSRDPYVTGSR